MAAAQESPDYRNETTAEKDARMQWWRQARFGMFIHWGLYAVPAGEWDGTSNHAEWILTTAQIPVEQYEKFGPQFNPVKFNADQWVRMAKDAGMKYLVITSKHHDGFCLWDSDATDYDIMDRTPFKRDILKELSVACKEQGIKLCFYHSIMDWHHPDYLPRRKWEKRSADGADYTRYISYMKAQLKELVLRYDPAVLWFDGEWEKTWTHEDGLKLYDYVRSLKPAIIINNRVDKGRHGMQGTFDTSQYAGDFGTPEQEIPASGLDYDWESCITMNRYWGWNKHDKDFKSTEDLIHKLVDIASKGGNFLLNIGPKPDGTFPIESSERLKHIGQWMDVNGESIYGTTASPFTGLPWGRCTKRIEHDKTVLYLHVFDWPSNRKLRIPELESKIDTSYLLANHEPLETSSDEKGIVIEVPKEPIDPMNTVIVLEVKNKR
jgi:alpha-L-fucosidase